MARLGFSHIYNLRGCCKEWRSVCCEEIKRACVPADRLRYSMRFFNNLLQLSDITIKSHSLPAISICGNALRSSNASLKALSLTSRGGVEENLDMMGITEKVVGNSICTMVIEDLGIMLQPFHQTLEHLHLDHCMISHKQSSAYVNGQSFFSQLVRLRSLHLICSPVRLGGLLLETYLNLSGITSLEFLNCRGSNIYNLVLSGCSSLKYVCCQNNKMSLLSLSGCVSLESLNCHDNHLTILQLYQSPKLSNLQCSCNILVEILLSPYASLQTLSCAGGSQHPLVIGGNLVLELDCRATTFNDMSVESHQSLVKLDLKHADPIGHVRGLRDLHFLKCSFRETDNDSLDLRDCTNVELVCHCLSQHFFILGRKNVLKLTLTYLDSLPPKFHGFTNLVEINLILQFGGRIDLSKCKSLRKATMTQTANEPYMSPAVIDLCGCILLEELSCNKFPSLAVLYLSNCTSVTSLSCIGSGLRFLDVSWCPHLHTLNVSGSLLLDHVFTNNSGKLRNITTLGCGQLSFRSVQRDLHPSQRKFGAEQFAVWSIDAFLYVESLDLFFLIALGIGSMVAFRSLVPLVKAFKKSKMTFAQGIDMFAPYL